MTSSNRTLAALLGILLIAMLLGTACSSFRNIKASIAGTVYVDGRPQAFGTVQAYMNGALITQERCTQSGHYQLRDLDPGDYTVVYLNARGAPLGGDTYVSVRLGRFETVDLQLSLADTTPIN